MATTKKAVKAARPLRKATAKKAPAKAPVKAAAKAPAKAPVATAPVAPAARPAKAKKPKLVRDSFTIPKSEYAVLDALKQRAAKAGLPARKSEVLRAGVKALAAMSEAAFAAAMGAVPALKTGRPAKG